MQDRADRLSDRVEERCLADCAGLYTAALRRVMRRFAPVFKELEALETKRPPPRCITDKQKAQWMESERRRILRESGLARAVSREIAASGGFAAERIQQAMEDIDRINRVGDDIG